MVDDAQQRKVRFLESQPAHFDLRQVENIVHDPEEVLRSVVDLVQLGALLGVRDLLLEQVVEADDGVHRSAYLVTHVGEEGALGAACRLGGFLGFSELGGA